MNEKEIIEKLKHNTQCLLGLSENEKAVLEKYKEHVGYLGCSTRLHCLGRCKIDVPYTVYRIEESFQLPEIKWWFNTDTKEVINTDRQMRSKEWLEVSEAFAKYLLTPHEGFELRMAKKGDRFVVFDTDCEETDSALGNFEYLGMFDTGHRWCKILPKEEWFVADVGEDGYYINQNGDFTWVYNGGIKGFGGVQFHGQNDDWWYFLKDAAISGTGQVMNMVCDENQCRPARIARIRIWIGGDQ